MTILFIDRRCTVDVHQTAKGYSFKYGNKTYKTTSEEAVNDFFLKEYHANKLDTVKLSFQGTSYYLHFTLDKPEKCTKRQLRSILATECDGAWCEEKNGKQHYFVKEGSFFPKIRELTLEEFTAYQPTSTIRKAMQLALGVLSLVPTVSSHANGMGALLFPLLNAGTALAQMPAIGEFRLDTNTTYFQRYPNVASLNDGGFVTCWAGTQTGDYEIYGQRYEASGAPVESKFCINTNTSSLQLLPAVAALNNGGFVAVWQGQQTGDYDIYGQIYDAAGTKVGSEYRVNTNTTNNQRNPVIAALTDSSFVIIWQTEDSDICGQKYSISGNALGSEIRINTNTINSQDPTVAALNNGGFLTTWLGYITVNFDIYAQKYNISGMPVESEFRINDNTTGFQTKSAVATLNDGSYVIVWQGDQTMDNDIYLKRYDAAGAPMGSEFRVNTNTTFSQEKPSIIALKDGGFVIAWQGIQTEDYNIYGQRYNATLAPLGSEFRINTNTTDAQIPKLTALNDGGYVVVWESYQGGIYGIYGQRFDANNVPVSNFSFPSSALAISSTSTIASSEVPSTSTASSLMNTSQGGSTSNSPTGSSQSSIIGSPSFSQSPIIRSITEIIYGTDYSIDIDDVNVGTFTITGGTGLYDGSQSNTLILQLNPDANLDGQTVTLFTLPSGEEGDFQTIELQGVSCLTYDTQIVQDGSLQVYQVIFQGTTCSTGSKPAALLTPTMLRV